MPVFRRRRSRLYKILETFARGLISNQPLAGLIAFEPPLEPTP